MAKIFNTIIGFIFSFFSAFYLIYALMFFRQTQYAVRQYEKVCAALQGDFDLQTFCHKNSISHLLMTFAFAAMGLGNFIGTTILIMCGGLASLASGVIALTFGSKYDKGSIRALGVYCAIIGGTVVFVFLLVVVISVISGNTEHFLL